MLRDGYFVVETAMPLPFLAKKLPHGCRAERKTASDFIPTGGLIWGVIRVFLGVIFGGFALSASFQPFGVFRPERSLTQFFSAFWRFLLVTASSIVFNMKWTGPSCRNRCHLLSIYLSIFSSKIHDNPWVRVHTGSGGGVRSYPKNSA